MALEDRDYIAERAKARNDKESSHQGRKSTFNERKYHPSREWGCEENNLPDLFDVVAKYTKKTANFLKHRSGKNVPYSVKELLKYLLWVISVIGSLDRPHLPMEWRLIPIILMSALGIYVFRQLKIRTFDRDVS